MIFCLGVADTHTLTQSQEMLLALNFLRERLKEIVQSTCIESVG